MKYFGFLVLVLLPINSYSIEIENFKSGLMCGINKVDMGWVCFEQDEILVSGQSSCSSRGDEFKCTWYGYSFDYKNAEIGQEISCVYIHSEPVTTANLHSKSEKASSVNEFSFTLKKKEGYFVNPQYSGLRLSPDYKIHKTVQDVVCSSEGKKLYEFRFVRVFPPRRRQL